MKSLKLTSSVLTMLICFASIAQEKPIIEKSNDTITCVKISCDFTKPTTSINPKIECAKPLSKNNEPLYILDQKIVNAKKIAAINPNDIQDIKVLKGIDATSLYGNKAINGAIVITTKNKK